MASSLLLGALESGHEVVGVLRHDRVIMNPIKRVFKEIFNPDEFLTLIKKFKIKEIKAKSANSEEFFKKALRLQPDIILVGSWSEILNEKIINMPQLASINCHPSLLPKYRGPNPYMETIRRGEPQTGVTFHLINKKLDSGAILMQQKVDISHDDTGGTLRLKCTYTARKMLPELLNGICNGTTIPCAQNESAATYFPRIKPEDVIIDWNNNAEYIYNQIRAFTPWQDCFCIHKNKFLKVNSSKIIEIPPNIPPGMIIEKKRGNILVATGEDGKGILIEKPRVFGIGCFLFGKYYIKSKIKAGDILENF